MFCHLSTLVAFFYIFIWTVVCLSGISSLTLTYATRDSGLTYTDPPRCDTDRQQHVVAGAWSRRGWSRGTRRCCQRPACETRRCDDWRRTPQSWDPARRAASRSSPSDARLSWSKTVDHTGSSTTPDSSQLTPSSPQFVISVIVGYVRSVTVTTTRQLDCWKCWYAMNNFISFTNW